MRLRLAVLSLTGLAAFVLSGSDQTCISNLVIHTAAEWNRAFDTCKKPTVFELDMTGTALTDLYPQMPLLPFEDDTGVALVGWNLSQTPIRAGDRIHIFGYNHPPAEPVRHVDFLGHEAPPAVPEISADEFFENSHHVNRPVSLTGVIYDAVKDDVDANFIQFVLNCDGRFVHAALYAQDQDLKTMRIGIGRVVRVKGICQPLASGGLRYQCDKVLLPNGIADIAFLDSPDADPYDAPDLDGLRGLHPQDLARQGRRKVLGRVTAVWNRRCLLIKTARGDTTRIQCLGKDLPDVGETVEAVGFPVSDLFCLNLNRALWRKATALDVPMDRSVRVEAKDLFLDWRGKPHVHAEFNGKPLTFSGHIVRTYVTPDNGRCLLVENGAFAVTVDLSACPQLFDSVERGSLIDATGICVIETDDWTPSNPFPKIHGVTLVTRDPGDVTVLSRPPWWTPGKFIALIGTLMAVLVAILAWNAALRKVATRKGRELMREQIGHVKAELKTEERTRLAVELHDSLAQNLTGVSLEIDTAAKVADDDPAEMKTHLRVAARSLKSCRDELRNCLWDLRNRALEERTMDEAIRQTLAPHVAGVEVAVRFNVPRDRISDNTAHAILRIVRELALNGIRHGAATRIWIAGSIEGDRMLFSVRDNGSGFDPKSAPGFSEGHYGLLGIQERVDEFEGEFTLTSAPGKGTKATVSLKVPQEA